MSKMQKDYLSIKISVNQAADIASEFYNLNGKISILDGEIDFNFKLETSTETYLLKISRPNADKEYVNFQTEILQYVAENKNSVESPTVITNLNGDEISLITDKSGNIRFVRVLSWMHGRLWSSVNPKRDELLFSLGQQTALLTKSLLGYSHPLAKRTLEWDIAHSMWTYDYDDMFTPDQLRIIEPFQKRFVEIQQPYQLLRKSVIHNDTNDNNIVVTEDLENPQVSAIIDYGDAIYTQIINDLAVTIAYAVIQKPDVLSASIPVVRAYNLNFPLEEKEIEVLYVLVAMRLIISLTKSAINRNKEPDNTYLLISEKAAWDVLKKWQLIDDNLAHYHFRYASGFIAHPHEEEFLSWTKQTSVSINDLFPTLNSKLLHSVDMTVGSNWLGHKAEYDDNEYLDYKLKHFKKQNNNALIAGGYLEIRPFYTTDAYKKEGNNAIENRSVHLGIDFWLDAKTPIHSLFDGVVFSVFNNDNDKDYGPTIIFEHETKSGVKFFSLYGHLSLSSLDLIKKGQIIKKGDLIACVGNSNENGNWTPHLHFQLILDMMDNKHDFPGLAFPNHMDVWKSLCPDPNLLFKEEQLRTKSILKDAELINFRKTHLGKSLSLSYVEPLRIVRGEGVHLIDDKGRKYLDTANNVAHIGHEHPRVVSAGQKQMAILNTNSRYLHENINEFADELLSTFPDELSVVHFVNSGSEANELALRMAKTYTKQKDIIALEIGYHGNTSGCIDVSSYKFDGKGGSGAPEHTHIVPLPDSFRGMYQGGDTAEKYASHIQDKIDEIQKKGRKLAGFICESIVSCGGQIELPEDYLKIAFKTVRKAGGLCISDEVQVGCGRVGTKFWGFQLHDVVPDIVTIGKPIGNGHPLAAVVCTQEVANVFANGMEYFNTFGGNPVSCAIGKEVLSVIKDEKLQQNALEVGTYLIDELKLLQKEFAIIGDVRGKGLFLGFELVDENKTPLTKKVKYLANRMKELGVLMSIDGKDNNVLKIKPPLVFSRDNANELIFRLKTVFQEDFMKY